MTHLEPDPTKPKQPDKSLGDLFVELSEEFQELIRTQADLARTEIRGEVQKAGQVAGMWGAAGLTGFLALLLLSFAAAWGLSEIVPEGVAFLIVGVVYAIAAAVLFVRGRERARAVSLMPKDTVDSLKEDVQWAQRKLH